MASVARRGWHRLRGSLLGEVSRRLDALASGQEGLAREARALDDRLARLVPLAEAADRRGSELQSALAELRELVQTEAASVSEVAALFGRILDGLDARLERVEEHVGLAPRQASAGPAGPEERAGAVP
jgi:ABC-type transporter Mla subunit MlaD